MIDIVWLGCVSLIPGVDCLTFACRLQFAFCGHCLSAAWCLDILSTFFFLRVDRRCGWALSPSSFHVAVSLWLSASDSFSTILYGMIYIVWLGLVCLIPDVGSLPFSCRLLFTFVDTVFMWLGAMTVSLQFLGLWTVWLGPVLFLAFPVLPLGCLFRFASCSLVGSRLLQMFAFRSYLDIC